MSSNANPRLFIGSSSDSLPILEILAEELKDAAAVVPWNDPRTFRPTEYFKTSLLQAADRAAQNASRYCPLRSDPANSRDPADAGAEQGRSGVSRCLERFVCRIASTEDGQGGRRGRAPGFHSSSGFRHGRVLEDSG